MLDRRHSSRECWNPGARDGKYTTSTFSALTFHGFWISALPAKMTSGCTTITIPVIPAGRTGTQWPGMESTQHLHSQHLPSMGSGSRRSPPCQDDERLRYHHKTVIPAGSAGIQRPGMGSTQHLHSQHLPFMDSGSRQSLPR